QYTWNDGYETSGESKPQGYYLAECPDRKVEHRIVHQGRVFREIDGTEQHTCCDHHREDKAEAHEYGDDSDSDADNFSKGPEYAGNAVKDERDQSEWEEEDFGEYAFFTILDIQPFLNIGFNIRKGNRLPLHLHSVGDRMCFWKDDPQHDVDEQSYTTGKREHDKENANDSDVYSKVCGDATGNSTQRFSFRIAEHLLVVGLLFDVKGTWHRDP